MDATELASSNEFGRHLLLKRGIPAATTVLEQLSYAAVLYDDQVPQRCDFCFAPSDNLMRCSRSKFAHYCSIAHQRAAWKVYYKKECEALIRCAPKVPPATVRLAARVLWRRASEHKQPSLVPVPPLQQRLQQRHSGFYSDIEQLESHWNGLDGSRKIMYAQMAMLTRQYMQGASVEQHQQPSDAAGVDDSNLPDVKHVAQLLARFACNSHTVCDEELRPIGVGIYPLGALINHSCTPNCVQSFEGPKIVFRSLRALSAGEQLTISYVELAATRQQRRRQLLQQYFFDVDTAAAAAGDTATENREQCEQLPVDLPFKNISTSGPTGALEEGAPAFTGLMGTSCQQQEPIRIPLQQLDSICWGFSDRRGQAPVAVPDRGEQSSSSWLISYPNSSRPPWPESKPDKQLCQMLLLLPASQLQSARSTSNTTASSISSEGIPLQYKSKLPGGMCLFAQTQTAADDAAATARLFADLDILNKDSLSALNMEDDDPGTQPVIDDLQAREHIQQQQQQQVEVVQWGDWGAVASSNTGTVLSTTDLSTAAANTVLHVWGLQQQAEQLAAQGDAAAAVQVYQQALHAADGQQIIKSVAGTAGSPGSCRVALGSRHILRAQLDAGLQRAAISEGGRWEVALSAAQRLTPVYQLVYPKVQQQLLLISWRNNFTSIQVWPNLGLHYALVAKLALYLQQPAAAAQAATAAGEVLKITHTGSSQVLHEVIGIGYEAQQELEASSRAHGE